MTQRPYTDRVLSALERWVSDDLDRIGEDCATCGAHALVWRDGRVVLDEVLGHAQLTPHRRPLEGPDPVFDLASLTKPLVPATLAMQAIDEGLVTLDTPFGELVDGWAAPPQGARDATLAEVLDHTSGLPAWYKYYEDEGVHFDLEGEALRQQRERVLARVLGTPRQAPGQHHAYSDLGYMALMVSLERLFGDDLATLARQRIFRPLGMRHTDYVDRIAGDAPLAQAASTERCPHRGVVTGTVHDENTHVIGGVSGHAGAFGTARDLLTFARHLFAVDHGELRDGIVSRATLRQCWDVTEHGQVGHHLIGWDTPSGQRSSAGRGFGRATTVGHLGFTGTSLWIERREHLIAILLTNRVHPSRDNPNIFQMRVDFHEAALPPRG